jgi:hypothetical protein
VGAHFFASTPPATTGPTNQVLTVGGPNDQAIELVLAKARPGDRIILQDDIKASGVKVRWSNLTIESAQGTNHTWRPADKADPKTPLLDVESVEGVVVKGIHFDGNDKAETLIQLRGKCPGLLLQDLELTTFTNCGIRVTNAEGTQEEPIVFLRLKITHRGLAQKGILFDLDPLVSVKRPNKWFKVSECKSANGKLVHNAGPTVLENVQPPEFLKSGS